MEDTLTHQFNHVKSELTSYLCRLVLRPQVADELVQTTYLRCLEASGRLPDSHEGVRAWLFKVASNLAFDELRRHSTWREFMLADLRDAAQADAGFLAKSRALASSPETKAIAREHLVACIACTSRNLPEQRAAALWLKEAHGFSVAQTAELLDATPAQVKNWLQEARAHMEHRHGATCALVNKTGVCHQCIELDDFFAAGQGNPLKQRADIEARFQIASEMRAQPWGPWHRMMFELVDELA